MPELTLKEINAAGELSQALYSFLPGKAYPYSKIKVDFGTIAANVGVGAFWHGGSKLPAINALLESTLKFKRDRFCPLMINIVKEGLKYRIKNGNPITQEEMKKINLIIDRIGFKIPELVDPSFMINLPKEVSNESEKQVVQSNIVPKERLIYLEGNFLEISKLQPHQRGYAFEKFLHNLFETYRFNPRPSFKIIGEQIDGSLEFDHEIYLIEAKWQTDPVGVGDLSILQDRVRGHSAFGRGFFFTCGNFSPDGVNAFQRHGRSSIVGIDGQDLYLILSQHLPLDKVLRQKVRWLAETGDFHYPVIKFSAHIINDLECDLRGN
jgi:hypothetical protein